MKTKMTESKIKAMIMADVRLAVLEEVRKRIRSEEIASRDYAVENEDKYLKEQDSTIKNDLYVSYKIDCGIQIGLIKANEIVCRMIKRN